MYELSMWGRRGTYTFGSKIVQPTIVAVGPVSPQDVNRRAFGFALIQPDDGQWDVDELSAPGASHLQVLVAGIFETHRFAVDDFIMKCRHPWEVEEWIKANKNIICGQVHIAELREGLDLSARKVVVGGERGLLVLLENLMSGAVTTPRIAAHCEMIEPPVKKDNK